MSYNARYHHTAVQLQEEHLIIEAAKADPNHFAPLYDKYYKQIFGYLYQRMEDKDTAFDLTSQVFLKALTNIGRYQFKNSQWSFEYANRLLNAINSLTGDTNFEISLEDLDRSYETYCDPRLNNSQSLEMAFLISSMLKEHNKC